MTRKDLGLAPSGLTDTATVGWTESLFGTFIPIAQVGEVTTATNLIIDVDLYDAFNITALSSTVTIGVTGNPVDHRKLMVRVTDNGHSQYVHWSSSFRNSGVATLLAATVPAKTHHVGLIYDSGIHQWICLAVDATGA